ncbi:MAG: hypothetical protein AAGA80_18115 [Cyanobacteria bacterium P01_F01_bin.143]
MAIVFRAANLGTNLDDVDPWTSKLGYARFSQPTKWGFNRDIGFEWNDYHCIHCYRRWRIFQTSSGWAYTTLDTTRFDAYFCQAKRHRSLSDIFDSTINYQFDIPGIRL